MKNFSSLIAILVSGLILFTACKDDEEEEEQKQSILPSSMTIDVPAAISAQSTTKSASGDTLKGDDIYEMQRTFVAIAEFSALLVDELITSINQHNLSQPMTFTFTSDDDGREKTVTVTENASYDNESYQYKLHMTDQDGGTAMQLFWNKSPVKGVAILDFYEMDRVENPDAEDALLQLEYNSEDATYDETMVVSIYNHPLDDDDQFSVDNLKMFFGKKGSVVDLYGTSNHPKARMSIDSTGPAGISWAFTARADDDLDIAVAKVALPPNSVSSTSGLFTSYSLEKVFNDLYSSITDQWVAAGYITQEQADAYIAAVLKDAKTPAYFSEGAGYISSGPERPEQTGFTSDFVDLSGLSPYAPKDIADLTLSFQEATTK